MRLRPIEHLENRKMHTYVFYNWSTKKTEPTVLFKTKLKPKPNRTRGFCQNRTKTEPNLKNPFRTSLQYITMPHLQYHKIDSNCKKCGK